MAKILVIEDDPILADVLQEYLESFGYQVEVANDGLEGFELLKYGGFDLSLIDWHLPSLEGPQICQKLRIAGCKIPILMLTERSATKDKASGLDAGADDYLAKPFEVDELSARVRALLRRSTALFDKEKDSGRVKLNYADATVTIDGRSVELLKKEFQLLEFMLRHPNTYFTTEDLIKHVWDSNADVGDVAVKTCISRLRKKIDLPGEPSLIETAKGWGYKISESCLK